VQHTLSAATVPERATSRRIPVAVIGIAAVAFLVFWLANRTYDAGRGDLFYLADAFLHGRVDIPVRLGPQDVIVVDGRFFVPFPPFPAIALMPVVALVGPAVADQWEPAINALLGAVIVAGAWLLTARLGVRRSLDRTWLTLLMGFSTPVVWLVTRGGVWHTGQLIATILTLALRRRRRASRLADRVRARLARQIPGPGDGSSATAPS